MKAPKGQLANKKIPKDKKKQISSAGSTDKNTHICPGMTFSPFIELFSIINTPDISLITYIIFIL